MRVLPALSVTMLISGLLVACTAGTPTPMAHVEASQTIDAQSSPTPSPIFAPPVSPHEAIQPHAVDAGLLLMVSRFRSMIGHGSYFTAGCSSKHYFVPLPSLAYLENGVPLHSPVTGTVWRIGEERPRGRGDMLAGNVAEENGHQVHIRVEGNGSLDVILYHVTLLDGINEGSAVTAGQRLGSANVKGNSFDIAIELWTDNEATYLSYFELMPTALFAAYKQLGLLSRNDLVISEQDRLSNPLEFGSPEAAEEGWVFLAVTDEPR